MEGWIDKVGAFFQTTWDGLTRPGAGSESLWQWLGFGTFVAICLAVDLGVFHRKSKVQTLRAAAIATACWCGLALAFNVYVWKFLGDERVSGWHKATEFLTGYLIEWSLSMDNVFVFAVIFKFFHVPPKYQYRVLFWGILGAVFMRLAFVLVGAEILRRFDWAQAILGIFLVYTAVKLAVTDESQMHPEKSWVLRLGRKLRVAGGHYEPHPAQLPSAVLASSAAAATGASLPTAESDVQPQREPTKAEMESAVVLMPESQIDETHLAADMEHVATGERFFVRHKGKLCVTPLFLVLMVVESTDVLFAVDSVPAIFGVTKDPFIVFTSNIFAILGLRSLYFLLAGVMDLFHYLKYGLAVILGFIGLKMGADYLWAEKYGHNGHLIEPWQSLLVVVGILALSIVASLWAKRREAARQADSQ
ncbi:MAG: TerC family protein [Planctomycetia bacterium]|nr:TerC family protein [Planctomycetia bacterium]